MKAVDYFPIDRSLELAEGWVGSLDRKRKWEGGWGKTALLVLDLQRYFTDPQSRVFLPSTGAVLANVERLMDRYEGPVICTAHSNRDGDGNLMTVWWKGIIEEEMADLDPALNRNDCLIIRKEHYSAFRETDLDSILKEMNVETVIISGVMTDLCCETTARDAFMRGFKVVLLADCTATDTEERHIASLGAISRGFGEVLTSRELLSRS